jgi:hypothetical protein
MSNLEEFDVVVLGSGEAGKFLAWTLASQGQRAAVIERKYLGGSCPNIACLPSKNVIHTAKVASYLRRGEEFGIAKQGWKIDMAVVRDRKRKMVDRRSTQRPLFLFLFRDRFAPGNGRRCGHATASTEAGGLPPRPPARQGRPRRRLDQTEMPRLDGRGDL